MTTFLQKSGHFHFVMSGKLDKFDFSNKDSAYKAFEMMNMIQKYTKILALVAITGMSSLVEAQQKWSPAGPIYTAGRARNMVVDKNDASGKTLFVGSTSSGVFKSIDGGVNWEPVDDQGSVRNISYMAQAPDGTIYAATGEGFLRLGQKAKALPGTGLYKLTGNSLTQVVSSSVVGTVINRVAVSPASSNNIALTTNNGVYISTNGGSSFNLAPGIPTATNISGQDVKFDAAGNLYCSVGSESGTSTLTATRIFKSTSALTVFSECTPTSSVLPDKNYGRIELAIAPGDNNTIYASCANKNTDGKNNFSASMKGLFVSYDAGTTWALIVQGSPMLDPLSNGFIASGDYAHVITVSPTDRHTLFYGGYSMYIWKRNVGSNGDSDSNPIGTWQRIGSNFAVNTPFYLHENIHDVKIIPASPNTKYYFITDAGIYRSTDLTVNSQTSIPSFQPFYKGLVTGQFNSVSIERFPVGENAGSTAGGTKVVPYSGFIGGTGGNGLIYYSGTSSLVTQESSYLSGDIYNTEYSKILPNAAFATTGSGAIYRSSNVKTSSPTLYSVNKYTGALSRLAPEPQAFSNANITTGTPFKLWEYYGQNPSNPDQVVFYNDSLRFQTSVASLAELTSTRIFTLNTNRPNRFAQVDSMVIRTATLALAQTANPPAFTTGKTITIKLNNNYVNSGTLTTLSGSVATVGGDNGPESPTVTLNNATLIDDITVAFLAPPFGDKTVSTTNPAHYRVYATVFYKYKAGDSVAVTDNNISTLTTPYRSVFPANANWQYGSGPAYQVTTTANAAVSNPTYVVAPLNVSSATLPVTVNMLGQKSVTLTQYGTYTISAKPVEYTLSVTTNTNVSGSTYSFQIQPGGTTQTLAATATTSVKFLVTPTVATNYTVTQTGTGTLTAVSVLSIASSSYVLNPGNVTQASPVFSVLITPSVAISTYTAAGVSSNTLIGANTSTVTASYPVRVSSVIGTTVVPFPPNNAPVKIPMRYSARLAVCVTNGEISGNADAVAVSKNPLALNDPGNFVRVSQSGAMTDDSNGNASTNTITVDGRPTILEWSKSGTELYYATDANKLYRVSHITDIMDLSPTSYNGKFHTDIFQYNTASGNLPNAAILNMNSPYRTTLIGSFDVPVTSISVAKDDAQLVVTFNNPAQTGTTGIVMHSGTSNVKTSNSISWQKKDAGLTNMRTYCSLIEKDDVKKVYLGTDQGLYYTSDITSGNWVNVNNNSTSKVPNVQIFDVKQQVLMPWDCYNSGQIYIATNGRGVWTNTELLKNYYVGIQESEISRSSLEGLKIYPNPSSANVNISFEGFNEQNARLTIMDLSGRLIKTEELSDVSANSLYTMDTANLTAGIYLVNVTGENGTKRTAKLIVTK